MRRRRRSRVFLLSSSRVGGCVCVSEALGWIFYSFFCLRWFCLVVPLTSSRRTTQLVAEGWRRPHQPKLKEEKTFILYVPHLNITFKRQAKQRGKNNNNKRHQWTRPRNPSSICHLPLRFRFVMKKTCRRCSRLCLEYIADSPSSLPKSPRCKMCCVVLCCVVLCCVVEMQNCVFFFEMVARAGLPTHARSWCWLPCSGQIRALSVFFRGRDGGRD